MKALSFLLALVAVTAVSFASEAEDAALRGIEAMNRNQGAPFVSVAHPELIRKIRDMMVARFEKAVSAGEKPTEFRWYGVTSLEDLRALPFDQVTKVTIDHMSDSEPARLREMMHTAKFAVVSSSPLDEKTVVVSISIDLGDDRSPKTIDVWSRPYDHKWKYWGFPELAKE